MQMQAKADNHNQDRSDILSSNMDPTKTDMFAKTGKSDVLVNKLNLKNNRH